MTLQIFPKHPTSDDVYYINGSWAPASITAADKRFTDAELAAEYWQAYSGVYNGHGKKARQQIETIRRFFELPHHDQEPA